MVIPTFFVLYCKDYKVLHALYFTVLNCKSLYCTVLHCTVLNCTVPHCTVLYTAMNCPVVYSGLCPPLADVTLLRVHVLHKVGSRHVVIILEEVLDGAEDVVQEGLHGLVLVLGHPLQPVVLVRIQLHQKVSIQRDILKRLAFF